MAMNRGFWLVLAAVVVVMIGWFVWPTANQTMQAPATAQAPVATPPVQPTVKESAGTASAPQAPAPAPAAAPSAQVAEKEFAPAKRRADDREAGSSAARASPHGSCSCRHKGGHCSFSGARSVGGCAWRPGRACRRKDRGELGYRRRTARQRQGERRTGLSPARIRAQVSRRRAQRLRDQLRLRRRRGAGLDDGFPAKGRGRS